MFKAVDTDGSGLIELPEFLEWFRREELKQQGLPSGRAPAAAENMIEDEEDDESDLDEKDLHGNLEGSYYDSDGSD